VPGSKGPLDGVDEAQAMADEVGYPIMVKAASGGGGRGMRIVRERESLARAYATCQSEARASFGSSDLYLEKFVEEARHVEVQVLGDRNGIRVHMGERDCSIQRRHQKLLEESPATSLSPATRAGLCKSALAVANAVNYVSAGTVELLVDRAGSFYFIEMNTRIQVEHPVTELVTGFDLVREQIRIAAGESLGYKQDAIQWSGHAIECRINAEDPEHFTPSPGRVTAWMHPDGTAVRVDVPDGRLRVPAALRFARREDHRACARPRRGGNPNAPGALRDRRGGDQDHHPLSPEAPRRSDISRGRVRDPPIRAAPLAAALRLELERFLEQDLRFIGPARLCELVATPPERLAKVGADAGKGGRDLEHATQGRERVFISSLFGVELAEIRQRLPDSFRARTGRYSRSASPAAPDLEDPPRLLRVIACSGVRASAGERPRPHAFDHEP
jgi:hypothetical protein